MHNQVGPQGWFPISMNAILEATLLIYTSLVAESWIFLLTHDLP